MPGLLIIAHAPLASSLEVVARHVYPDSSAVLEALDVPADMSPDEVEARARILLAKVKSPEALILTDVFGATPCNVAQRLADGIQVRLVTGVNVPMMWRALCYWAEPLEALVARAVAGATHGVMQVTVAKPQNQASQPGVDDQVQRHDQQ